MRERFAAAGAINKTPLIHDDLFVVSDAIVVERALDDSSPLLNFVMPIGAHTVTGGSLLGYLRVDPRYPANTIWGVECSPARLGFGFLAGRHTLGPTALVDAFYFLPPFAAAGAGADRRAAPFPRDRPAHASGQPAAASLITSTSDDDASSAASSSPASIPCSRLRGTNSNWQDD